MIRSFKCKETENIFKDVHSRKIPTDIQSRALNKLILLDTAISLEDLSTPPSNHLEKLIGDLLGAMSIRINDQWRLCFFWQDGESYNVKIIDYHEYIIFS